MSFTSCQEAANSEPHGPVWLNDTDSEKTRQWVQAETAHSLEALDANGQVGALEREAAAVLTDPSRIVNPMFIGDMAYQYWRDAEHPLGIWRRTGKALYLAGAPDWRTVIDLDALSAAEGRKWFFDGADCRGSRCLIRLSLNGMDTGETREFDLDTLAFVQDGFAIPSSKSDAWWYDADHLIVAPALAPDDLNASGLPMHLRLWRRGTPITAAETKFSIGHDDAFVSAAFVHVGDNANFIAIRHPDFEARDYQLIAPDGGRKTVPLPVYSKFLGTHGGRLYFRVNTDWTAPGAAQPFKAGSVISVDVMAMVERTAVNDARLVYAPEGNDGVRDMLSADGRLFLALSHAYRSRVVELALKEDGPADARLVPLAEDRFISLLGLENGKLLIREEGLLTPPRIALADPMTGAGETLYAQKPAFDSGHLVSEILETKSADGTPISYSVVRPRDLARDGKAPTLVYGYGGYDVALTPRYEPLFGKLWVEKGGVYVHAYLRGGGEHGPAWHRGAMRTHRQQPFDDMAAILKDLHRRGISSPQHTGIMGRSNGGLMVATVMEQAPELMNAVIVGGPLIDMLDFHELPPGGTWTAEYGDPRDPEMRAFLRGYSPMQNIAGPEVRYPVPLIITSSADDRVLPGHARRFVARLREQGHEALYYEDDQGGHYWELAGGPGPGDWRLRATARAVEYAYLWRRLKNDAGE